MNDYLLGAVILIIAVTNYVIIDWMMDESDKEAIEREEEFKRELESHWHGKEK